MRILELEVEPMTAEAFAPFGHLGLATERPADERLFFPVPFSIDGRPTLDVIWQPYARDRRFSLLERHFAVAQGFVPLAGPPSVVCVAPPTDPDDEQAIPKPEEVRAFRIAPGTPFVYHTGTWHSLDRHLLSPPGATFLILNVDPNPTQVVDYAERFGVTFEVAAGEAASG